VPFYNLNSLHFHYVYTNIPVSCFYLRANQSIFPHCFRYKRGDVLITNFFSCLCLCQSLLMLAICFTSVITKYSIEVDASYSFGHKK